MIEESFIVHQKIKRLIWIDWMKAVGMYLIVAGHFFSLYHKYIYIFSVPVFFVISGFLTKREENHTLFWKKIWYNLVIPMIIICGITYVMHLVAMLRGGLYFFDYIYKFPLNALKGNTSALGRCWFIYTLIAIKILYQYLPKKTYKLVMISMGMLSISWILNTYSLLISATDTNAIINVCLAFPFFLFGIYLRPYRNFFDRFNKFSMELIIFLISILVIISCGKFNGYVWMYANIYGESIILFIIGGLAGSCALFILCKWLTRKIGDSKVISDISKGSIIILGFHFTLITLLPRPTQISISVAIIDYIIAGVIVLLFVPVIRFSEKYFPSLIGKYRP